MDVLGTFRNALRMNGEAPFVTDEGNHILDLHLQAHRQRAAVWRWC